jgi:DNA-binding Lrp family transcriptional regulator
MDLRVLTFAEAKQPEFKEKKGEGYIQYGDRNDYPNYLVELFNKSAKHNAIIKSKVHYITANGWSGSDEAKPFIDQINRMESLEDLTRKVSLDAELFGGYYLEIIFSVTGQLSEIWHCDYTKIRTNKDNTQFWYKEDWADRAEKAEVYPAFNPANPYGKQILYIKEYRPNMGYYSLPGYFGALNYIESDIEISKHVLGNAQTGFSASKLITLPNGEPSDDEKRNIEKRFTNRFSGSDGKKFILAFVNDSARKPIVDDLGTSDITKEDFGRVDTLIQTNIFSGHQITTPSIFGIAEAGKLGSRSEMRDGYEIFKNTYVNSKQMHLESVFNMLFKYRGIENPELKIIPTEAIGIELTENILLQIMSKDELRDKVGLMALEEKTSATNQDVINAINNLSPLVATKVLNQFTPNELRALVALQPKEGGEDIQAPQAQAFSDDFSVFFEFGEDKDTYNIWKSKTRFNDDSEYQLFAEVNQLQANVLDLMAKDKRITPQVLATTLDQSVDTINEVIKKLIDDGHIKPNQYTIGKGIDENVITEHTLTEPLKDILEKIKPQTTELLIRYSYEWKAGFSNSDKDTSRPFCVALLDANKVYSRSEIESMSARLGYSVWDRKGGWYTKPGTNDHEPSCRHQWVSNIVTRKK